jgi:hypothetical protein
MGVNDAAGNVIETHEQIGSAILLTVQNRWRYQFVHFQLRARLCRPAVSASICNAAPTPPGFAKIVCDCSVSNCSDIDALKA